MGRSLLEPLAINRFDGLKFPRKVSATLVASAQAKCQHSRHAWAICKGIRGTIKGSCGAGHGAQGHIRAGIDDVRNRRLVPMLRAAHPTHSELDFAGARVGRARVSSADQVAVRCSLKGERLSLAESSSPDSLQSPPRCGAPPQKPAGANQLGDRAAPKRVVGSAAHSLPRGRPVYRSEEFLRCVSRAEEF